jgi:hypothetical protein
MALFLLTTIIMGRQSRHFYLQGITRMPFSIFDLEFPGDPKTLPHIMRDIDNLPNGEGIKVRKSLRGSLLTDFVFMPATYIGIFLLCIHTANKMEYWGKIVFNVLAWMQVLPWLFDMIENLYILNKMKRPVPSSLAVHKAYVRIVQFKWGIACTAAVCAAFGSLYFWIVGEFDNYAINYLLILAGEIAVFMIISRIGKKKLATA